MRDRFAALTEGFKTATSMVKTAKNGLSVLDNPGGLSQGRQFSRFFAVEATREGTRVLATLCTDAVVTGSAARKGADAIAKLAQRGVEEAAAKSLTGIATRTVSCSILAPAVECVSLALDGQKHTKRDYLVASGAGAAGAAAGALAGSVVPVFGTVIGLVAGWIVSNKVKEIAG